MPQLLGFAVIGADGTELHLSEVSNVEHVGIGLYRITFASSVYNACEIASLAHWETAGCITAYGVPPFGPNVVEVMTFSPSGTPQDLTFQLLVIVPDVNITTGTVPDVVKYKLSPQDAKTKIEQAGFIFSRTDDPQQNVISPYAESQNPNGGTVAPLGTTVNVDIAVPHKGPTP